MKYNFAYLSIGILLLFNRCAQIVPLSGGQKDVTPPKLVEAVPALNSTKFNSDLITLKFDEFVQLKDLSNQLIVTPRLKTDVELNADGKKINITLKKEELKPNTTYRIFIGRAIADMTESNSIPDFEYVFSTGDKLDTLELKGAVSEAFSNASSPGIIIGLYSMDKKGDSIPFLEKPDYFTRSNDNGEFLIKNLPAENFRVYGIADVNKNSIYDGETEKIAFLSSDMNLRSDTSIQLKLYQEEASKVFIKKTLSPSLGLFHILLNKPSLSSLQTLRSSDKASVSETNIGLLKDTISIYYKNIKDTLGLVLYNQNSKTSDTLNLVVPKKRSSDKNIKNIILNTHSDKLALETKLKIIFPLWMDTTLSDLSKLRLTCKEDSAAAPIQLQGRWTNITTFQFDTKLKEGFNYKLKLDTNAFFDVNHLTNDSSVFNFAVQSKTDFGKVRLKLKLNLKQGYIVQLLNEQNVVSKEEFIQFSLSSSNATSIDFTDVSPGNYSVKIIYDTNNNHKWDRGDLMRKKLPEEVIINSKQIKVLSDWEIEEEITVL